MTTFQFFKAQYDANHDYMVECIKKDIPEDSFRFVQVAAKFAFGGTHEVDQNFNIIGTTDGDEVFKLGYIKRVDTYRYGKPYRHVSLTAKGLKAFYCEWF